VLDGLRRLRPPSGELADALARIVDETDHFSLWQSGFARETPTGARLLDRPPEELTGLVLDVLEIAARRRTRWELTRACADVAGTALRRSLPFDDGQLERLLDRLAAFPTTWGSRLEPREAPVKAALGAVERRAGDGAAPRDLHRALERLAAHITDTTIDGRAVIARIARLTGTAAEPGLPAGDPWLDAMLAARAELPGADRVLVLAATATSAKPTKAFTAACGELGADAALAVPLLEAALAVRDTERHGIPSPEVGDVLRGLAFIATGAGGEDAARALAELAIAGWRKVPDFGPFSAKAANAAIGGLAELPEGAAQLGRLRGQLKRATAVAAVEKAIERAAERLGIPRAEFEERAVPDFGLDASGARTVQLGEHTAVLDGTGALTFHAPTGRALKTVPKAVKEEHPEALADLKRTAKDLKAMASGQRLRLERLLAEDRIWTGAEFRERYLEHGLVAPLARRLIWTVDGESTMFGEADRPADGATIRLWHPVDAPPDEVLRWRRELEAAEVTQPFKQAHREIYLLTDAERTTETYSNRFAAHVLRQHQMAALAETRGWRYGLQGRFDSGDSTARLALPQHGLEAQLWIEVPHDHDDFSEMGIFNHVISDQVRFEDDSGAAVPLERIPVRVFSEAMRDVDLFVGVTSIGNDPAWVDHGDRRYDEYWTAYAFGELGEQAKVRAEVLERLLPKLAIGAVAEIDGRYLRVRGKLRTYRIHLGSSNILMEPNDEYLCIVGGRDRDARSRLYLPFEGDHMLALILSKALLLARDDEIEDRSITTQIRAAR
jgi:hypothetical protein